MSHIEIFTMEDVTPALDTRYVSFSHDGDIRSPRSPMWSPPTPASPFEYDRFLRTPEPKETKPKAIAPPPDSPLPWVWQCHLCRNRYPLGVTRRCLYDGHYYCSGDTGQPNLKKKKGRACSSEFDYEGWEEYAEWKHKALKEHGNSRVSRGCETCAFPSQCRTPAALYPPKKEKKKSASLVVVSEPVPEPELREGDLASSSDEVMEDTPSTSFDSILKDLMRDEEELLLKEETAPKRSKSKERNFSKKFSLSVMDEEQVREEVAQSLSDLVMPVFDMLSGKSKSAKGKST